MLTLTNKGFRFFLFLFHPHYLMKVVLSLLTIPFPGKTQEDLPGALKYLAQIVTNVLLLSIEYKKVRKF